MKRNNLGNVVLASLFLLSTTAVFAQTAVKATVPFGFKAGTATLPAGQYLITEDSARSKITIRNLHTNASVQVPAASSTVQDGARLKMVFHHYGDTYFLSAVHEGSDGVDVTLPATREEKNMQSMQMTSAIPVRKPQGVEIALR